MENYNEIELKERKAEDLIYQLKTRKPKRTGRRCKKCSIILEKEAQRKYCLKCAEEEKVNASRNCMRKLRSKENTIEKRLRLQKIEMINEQNVKYACQVCNYSVVLDIHHEGKAVYILCPNHHATITRSIRTVEDYGIKYLGIDKSK